MIGLSLGTPTAIPLPDKISGITDESEIERYRQGLAKVQGERLFAEQQEELEGMRESVGMLGDALLIDKDAVQMKPCHNLISNLVYSADTSVVASVVCNGRILQRNWPRSICQ